MPAGKAPSGPPGGPTRSCNLAPRCRPHHRLDTHTGWTDDLLDTGTYLWTTPHGHRLRRDPTGPTPLNPRCGCHHRRLNSSSPDP